MTFIGIDGQPIKIDHITETTTKAEIIDALRSKIGLVETGNKIIMMMIAGRYKIMSTDTDLYRTLFSLGINESTAAKINYPSTYIIKDLNNEKILGIVEGIKKELLNIQGQLAINPISSDDVIGIEQELIVARGITQKLVDILRGRI